jgi:hypothetical protein
MANLEAFAKAVEAAAGEMSTEPESVTGADETIATESNSAPSAEVADTKVEPAPAAEEPDAAPEPDASAELQQRAESVGISAESLAEFGDKADSVISMLEMTLDRKTAEFGKQLDAARTVAPAAQVATQAPAAAPVVPAPSVAPANDLVKVLTDKGYAEDEPVVMVVKALQEKNASLEAMIAQANQRPVEDTRSKVVEETEKFFESVPKEYQDIVGKGSTFSMSETSKERAFRMQMVETMHALDVGFRQQGKAFSIADLGRKALAMHASDRMKEVARKEMAGRLQKRSGSATTPPAGKKAESRKEPTEDDALAEIAGLMKEHGLATL